MRLPTRVTSRISFLAACALPLPAAVAACDTGDEREPSVDASAVDSPTGSGGYGGAAPSAGGAGGVAGGGTPPAACADARYGDGTCQTDLACEAPDVDCFRTFADRAEAEAWFAGIEATRAALETRPPRAVVPSSDPRWARMRALLDRGWASYRRVNPVGDLAEASPALVVIDDPSVNAFVMPEGLDAKRAALAVVVHTGTLDRAGLSDDAMLGLVMHELEHAIGLHVIEGVADRLLRFYLAPGGREPLGFEQPDEPVAREHGVAWRALAREAGPVSFEQAGGLPVGGPMSLVLRRVLAPRLEGASDACKAALTESAEVSAPLLGLIAAVEPALPPDGALGPRAAAVMAALRDDCLGGQVPSLVEVVADLQGVAPEDILAAMSERDRELVTGKHVVDAVDGLLRDRRAGMRAIEAQFAERTGAPWSALRFFSDEEAADDATVPVLGDAGLRADGVGEFFLDAFFAPASSAECVTVLEAGRVPHYGLDLDDRHHATCWRVHHVRAMAARAGRAPAAAALAARRRAAPSAPAGPPRARWLPKVPSDVFKY
jgi:hypothetical protein